MVLPNWLITTVVTLLALATISDVQSLPTTSTEDLEQIMGEHLMPAREGRQIDSGLPDDDEHEDKHEDGREVPENKEAANCEFGLNDVNMCSWTNLNVSAFRWLSSSGKDKLWVGGPGVDQSSNTEEGGYGFFETSQLPNAPEADNTVSAMMASPLLKTTGSLGHCLSFGYAMEGLSADKLRILLLPFKEHKRSQSGSIVYKPDFKSIVVLSTLKDTTMGKWKSAQIMYTFPGPHKVVLEAIPKDETEMARRFRGYIAVDQLAFATGDNCRGHCNFDSGFCGFLNTQDALLDDFDWQLGRGSQNPNTGPIRDHSSFTNNRVTGGYAYIDTGAPRRPQDKAHLMSQEFEATDPNNPMCLRFWTHMFGSGIGELNVYIRGNSRDEMTKIWSLSGDAGNNWYMGQAPVAHTTPYRIVFEGVAGRNSLGNIAIDDLSLSPGVCPTSPQVASSKTGDCAFEDDNCGWRNPERRDGVDELNWERVEVRAATDESSKSSTSGAPATDHTTGSKDGYYLMLSRNAVQRAGDRALLMSKEMDGSDQDMCLSFWYYMYEPIVDNTGPNLGKLSVWIRSSDRDDKIVMTPIWRLQNGQGPSWKYAQAKIQSSNSNYQIVIEGVWGNNRVSGFIAIDDLTVFPGSCDSVPNYAELINAECTFDRDSCNWRNTSTGDFEWRMATLARRPNNLPDKTFGAPVGYAYFDIFNTGARSNKVRMIGPKVTASDNYNNMCFSFWVAAFGDGETTSLTIYRRSGRIEDKDDDDDSADQGITIWKMSAVELDTARSDWVAGQVSINSQSDFKIVMEGKASNGGFAIDQLVFSPGTCKLRPPTADPSKDSKK